MREEVGGQGAVDFVESEVEEALAEDDGGVVDEDRGGSELFWGRC